jgi:glycosyltransferase involved in cell wall biosynthesis
VVPPRDSGAVARAIVAALEPARWAALSEDAVRAVDRRWNWGNAARVASALYEEVLAGAG